MPFGRVHGKIALITGAASGIGKQTARLLAREGAAVLVTDIDAAGADATAKAVSAEGGRSLARKLDVTQEPEWEQAIADIEHQFGSLTILVANAGISFAKAVHEMSLDEWRHVMAVNLDGVFLGTKHPVRAMSKGSGGSIVIVSSASGIKASPGASAYCSSKAALTLLAKTVALECRENGHDIRVNTVLPAGVVTPLWKTMDFWPDLVAKHGGEEAAWKALGALPGDAPLKRFAAPEEIAQGILYLASDESSFVTGAELVIDGGYTA
jgi:3(or 17)beta-hydroxysteroid dehydrogenase